MQRIEIRIFLQFAVAGAFVASEFRHHRGVEHFALCGGECWRVAAEAVENDFHVHLCVAVVGKLHRHVGEVESIAALNLAPHTLHPHHITVGNEVDLFVVVRPIVIVFAHQQHVVAHQLILTIENAVANATVEERGTLIAACHHYGFAHAVAVVTVADGFEQKLARHVVDVVEPQQFQLWSAQHAALHHISQNGGVEQNAALCRLTRNLLQVHAVDLQGVTA